MSGGRFDYRNYILEEMAEVIEDEIKNNNKPPFEEDTPWIWEKEANKEFISNGSTRYTPETIEVFKQAINAFKLAYIYAHRIDYFLSGDDGEEEFHKRLADNIKKLNEKNIN